MSCLFTKLQLEQTAAANDKVSEAASVSCTCMGAGTRPWWSIHAGLGSWSATYNLLAMSAMSQFIWLVVKPPLLKIWVRQLGWWWFPIDGKIKVMFQSPPTSYHLQTEIPVTIPPADSAWVWKTKEELSLWLETWCYLPYMVAFGWSCDAVWLIIASATIWWGFFTPCQAKTPLYIGQ